MSSALILFLFAAGQEQHPRIAEYKEKIPTSLPSDTRPLPRVRAEAAPEELYRRILGDGEKSVDVRLLALNMDTDDAVERILMRGSDSAQVFKREQGVWWKLADLGWAAPTPGHTEIIYRMWKGHLYEVLAIADEYNLSFERRSTMLFGSREREYALRSTRTKTYVDRGMGKPRPPGTPRVSSTCTEFAWDAVKFRFAAMRTAAGACKAD